MFYILFYYGLAFHEFNHGTEGRTELDRIGRGGGGKWALKGLDGLVSLGLAGASRPNSHCW